MEENEIVCVTTVAHSLWSIYLFVYLIFLDESV